VIEGCCVQVILIFQIAKMMGVSPIQLLGTTTNIDNMSDLGFDLGTTILLSLIIAGIITAFIFLKYMTHTKKSNIESKDENGE
jgi:H+/gluconate symporter-like permease